jgi:hypothetical protein
MRRALRDTSMPDRPSPKKAPTPGGRTRSPPPS